MSLERREKQALRLTKKAKQCAWLKKTKENLSVVNIKKHSWAVWVCEKAMGHNLAA